ncbi:MAG TPA: DUF4350 domain-containing protein [Acidobacteriaceae bacterium]|nr:DUF4350 domain-containing protein [Acidobacteriaceae bacterium]
MKRLSGEWKFLVIFSGCVVALIGVTGILAPARQDNDPTPSTWNSGKAGAKAAWLLLGQLGYREIRWERPEAELAGVDAAHATLVLADPSPSATVLEEKQRRQPFEAFLRRGGRIVATGQVAPLLLPDAKVDFTSRLYDALCDTTPEGPDALARAGSLSMRAAVRWVRQDPGVRVAQRCGGSAVVVSYPVGKGEVIWWASATPLTNQGLRQDGNLRLLLASVGGRERTVYFDEYMHGISDNPWTAAHGTPLTGMILQICLVAALLLFSFSRSSGPRRTLAQPPRTSPLEFVESMGALYARAGASSVAVSAALRRLTEFLGHEGGLPRETLRSGPEAVAAAVAARFGGDPGVLASDLEAARQAQYDRLRPSEALKLVRRLDGHIARLTQLLRSLQRYKGNA